MIEEQIEQQIFSQPQDKTFIDKLLGRKEADKVERIMKKSNTDVTRQDLQSLLSIIIGTEQKLGNYGDYDRYYLTKYFVWVRSFFEVLDYNYDYFEYVEDNQELGTQDQRLLTQVKNQWVHITKFMVDLYLHLSRSTMSLGGTFTMEAFRNKYEISYNQAQQQEENKKGFLRFGR